MPKCSPGLGGKARGLAHEHRLALQRAGQTPAVAVVGQAVHVFGQALVGSRPQPRSGEAQGLGQVANRRRKVLEFAVVRRGMDLEQAAPADARDVAPALDVGQQRDLFVPQLHAVAPHRGDGEILGLGVLEGQLGVTRS